MKDWWVYRYCPQAFYEDFHRFWEKDLLIYELEKRHFIVNVEVIYKETNRSMNTLLEDYTRRDVSQLAMIPDLYFEKGLEKIRNEIEYGVKEFKNIFALLEITAKKK